MSITTSSFHRAVLENLFSCPLTIPVIIIGTVMNSLPLYIIRRFETIIWAPQFYTKGNFPDFKANLVRFNAQKLIENAPDIDKDDEEAN